MNDLNKVGMLAAELIERLEEDYTDIDDVSVGIMALVVEINVGVEPQPSDKGYTVIEYRCSDGRRWIQEGLFHAALQAVDNSSEHPTDDD